MTDHVQALCEGTNNLTGTRFKFECDKKLVPLLKELNEAGIITTYSCQGNPTDPIDPPYISIRNIGSVVNRNGKKFYYLFTAVSILKQHWKNKYVGSYMNLYTGDIIFRACKTKKQLKAVSESHFDSERKHVWHLKTKNREQET